MASNACEESAEILALDRRRTLRITRSAFRIFLQPDWQNQQWLFQRSNHCANSSPSTQVGAQNKDFGAVLQMDLTRSLVPLVAKATSPSVLCEAQILVLHIKNISQQKYSSGAPT